MAANELTRDDSAVSPVVGVILLIALTVLLAATAATFMVGLTDQNADEGAPTAKFHFDYEPADSGSDTVTIEHESGEKATAENLYVDIEGAECTSGSEDPNGRYNVDEDFDFPSEEVTAGSTIQVGPDLDLDGTRDLCTGGGNLDLSNSSLTVLWDDGSASSTVYSWQP